MPDDRLDQRLTDLEIKASFAEDLLDDLNRLVAQQQDQIAWLLREVGTLRRQAVPAEPAEVRDLREDLPPHY